MNTRDRIAAAASRAPVNAVGDSRPEKEFNSLVSLWNQYFSIVEGIEARYPSLFIALISPMTAFFTLLYTVGEKQGDQTVLASILFAAVFCVTLMILAYFACQFRYTAVLRGELIRIERKLNHYLGENVYIWNTVQLNTPKTRGRVHGILFVSFLIVIIGLIIVSYAFIEAESPHWIRGLFLLGPFIDSFAYWIASNSKELLWVPITVLSVDLFCILFAFANNTSCQNHAASTTWDIAKIQELMAETDGSLFNFIQNELRVDDSKESAPEQNDGGISAGMAADGDEGVSAGASSPDPSPAAADGAAQAETGEGASHAE